MANLMKPLFSLLSPAGVKARLSTLIFHRVLPEPDPMFPDEMHAQRFDQVCGWLKTWFQVLPLDQAAARLTSGTLPARAACITFDDGYADNCHVAMPILQKHGLSATFFIATGFLDGGRMWNDTLIEAVRNSPLPELDLSSLGLGRYTLSSMEAKKRAISALIGKIKYQPLETRISVGESIAHQAQARLPFDLMLKSQEVKFMREAGMQIGAHTVSHPILSKLDDEAAGREIKQSKDFLEALLGEKVGLFAYPNGKPSEDYSPASVKLVRSLGFDAAVSTQWGTTAMQDDPYQIRRFTPWDRSKWRYGARLMANLYSSR